MKPQRWSAIWELFHQALEQPPERRPALLDELCAGDRELHSEVESLLAAHEGEDPLIDGAVIPAGQASSAALEGRQIGAYRLVSQIGAGGMGAVYLAERADEQFEQQVAIKLTHPGLDSEEILRRFQQERQILARLDHPNVARLFDGGQWEGRPYFVLEHVEGEPIDAYCHSRELSTEQLLQLFRKVCDAVHYAHQNLIVHRDLKPSNILVTEGGEPKLLDFGVAKLLDPEAALATATRSRLMTPHYASPEQIRGEPVTTQSDVYSLAVVLYELLSGRSPYRTTSELPHELARAILEDEPEPPSVAVRRTGRAAAQSEEGTDSRPDRAHLRQPSKRLQSDLDNIVLKALQKEPQRRYASAEQLSEDLRRHLEGLPVAARADTLLYRTSKFVARHRLAVAASSVAVLLLVVTTTLAVVQTGRTQRALVEASRERDVAESVTDFLRQTLVATDPHLGGQRTVSTRELLDRGSRRALTELADQPEVRARVQATLGIVYANLGLAEEAEQQLLQALETRPAIYGPDDPQVGEILNDLGVVRMMQGRLDAAESDLHGALERLSKLGPDNLHVGIVLEDLGALEVRRGNFDQAEAHLRESIRILEEASPDDVLPTSLIRLGALRRTRGDYGEAEELLLRGLEILRNNLRPHHTRVLEAERNLGDLYLEVGQLERAEELYRESLQGLREEELDTRAALNSLASVLRKLGRLEEAEELYREALQIAREQLGDEHPDTATPMTNLALVLQEQGDLDAAEPLARQVIAINEQHFGEDHPTLIAPLNNLGLLLQERGDLAGAEELFDRAENVARQRLGDRHPAVAFLLNNRGDLEHQRGDLESAERLFRAALELRREVLPEEHPDLAASLGGLGRLLVETERAAESEPLLRQALEIRLAHLPEDDWHVAEARSELGACLLRLARSDEAAPLLEAGYDGLLATKGEGDRRTKEARRWLERLRASSPPSL